MATIQLDPEMKVTAPRYEVPRTWSPARTVGLGGRSTASYAVVAPGGFQLIGRTPLELYDPKQRNVAFKDDPVLMRPGDRIRFIPISEGEYSEIRKKIKESTYRYEIEEGMYRLKQME